MLAPTARSRAAQPTSTWRCGTGGRPRILRSRATSRCSTSSRTRCGSADLSGGSAQMAVTGKRTGRRLVSLLPQLSVRGGLAALDFYRAAFGAEVIYQVGGSADNQAVVAELS